MSIEIRELGIEDLGALLDWRMEVLDTVFADEKPWDAPSLRDANRAYYEQHLGADHIACMASIDGIDAGCGAICLQDEMPSPDNPSGRCAYLMNVYTRDELRHQGVGQAVVTWLVHRAQAEGAGKIYLESTDAGRSLYEAEGFAPMDGMMKLR